MARIVERKLIEEFKKKPVFSRAELMSFYRDFEPNLKEGTLAWRIHDLKKRNIISAVGSSTYIISSKPEFNPAVSKDLFSIVKFLSVRFKNVMLCAWDTSWINEFSQHQSSLRMLMIEVENEYTQSLFYELRDRFDYDVFLSPDEKVIELYISESSLPVIVKKLLTRSPVNNRSEKQIQFNIPTLEKILVDLFAEKKLFYLYQGSELIHIFENALQSYSVNFTSLLSYAKRRDKETEMKEFMHLHLPHLIKDYIAND